MKKITEMAEDLWDEQVRAGFFPSELSHLREEEWFEVDTSLYDWIIDDDGKIQLFRIKRGCNI